MEKAGPVVPLFSSVNVALKEDVAT